MKMTGTARSRKKIYATAIAMAAALTITCIYLELKTPKSLISKNEAKASKIENPEKEQRVKVQSIGKSHSPPDEKNNKYTIKSMDLDFDRLLALSKSGDIEASKAIFSTLNRCQKIPATRRILKVAQKRALSETDPDSQKKLSDSIARYENEINFCGKNIDDNEELLPEITRNLAEAGDSEARLAYPNVGMPTDTWSADFDDKRAKFREDARKYIQLEIDNGNKDGLLTMALSNTRSPIAGTVSAFEPDPLTAYTYYYAYNLANSTDQQGNGSGFNTLIALESKLTPEEIQSARSNAERIAKCCKN